MALLVRILKTLLHNSNLSRITNYSLGYICLILEVLVKNLIYC
jgi:hypothetical protein